MYFMYTFTWGLPDIIKVQLKLSWKIFFLKKWNQHEYKYYISKNLHIN